MVIHAIQAEAPMFSYAAGTISLNLSMLSLIGNLVVPIAANESPEATENILGIFDIGIHSDAKFIHDGLNRVDWRADHKQRLVMSKIFEEFRWLVINMTRSDHHKLRIGILREPVGMGVAYGLRYVNG